MLIVLVRGEGFGCRSLLAHPDAPRDRPSFIVVHWMGDRLEGQLHLTMMVALVPDHVLEQQDRVVVVKVHIPACLYTAFYCIPHCLGTVGQHLGDATSVRLDHPLLLRQVFGELGSVLEN